MKSLFTKLLILPFILAINFLNAQEILFSESFDYTPGPLPPNWVIDAEQPPGWSINESQIAGGTYPELYLTYGFQAGLSRIISPAIDIQNHNQLAISYKQYLINYMGDWGETIGMDVTFDEGQSWQVLWEKPLGLLNIPQDEFHYFIEVPENATQMQIAFRFDGNNNGINGWAIDDIVVKSATNHDLLVTNLTGITVPNVGEPAIFIAEIQNGGKITQDNYTVRLKTSEGIELTSTTGTPIVFSQKEYVILDDWIPSTHSLGEHKIYAEIEFNLDENSNNNQSKHLTINVAPAGTSKIEIGDGSEALQHSFPYNFYNLHSLTQTMYLSSDIGEVEESKRITAIQYTCQFDEHVQDIPIEIYLAETSQPNLANEWLEPNNFTLVYDGLMEFPKGLHSVYIPLDTPFEYHGGNLVVYSNKTNDEQILWPTFMGIISGDWDSENFYSRIHDFSTEPYDAMNPPEGYMSIVSPNITLFFDSGEMAVIDNQERSDQILLYPNPTSNNFNLKSNKEIIQEVQIINSIGQVVSKQKFNENSVLVNTQSLRTGVYLALIITDQGIVTKKVIINQ